MGVVLNIQKDNAVTNSRQQIRDYLATTREICRKLSVKDIDKAVSMLYQAWERGATVFTCGNGGSAATAQHLACDLAKSTIVEGKPRLKVISLNDNMPLISALTNDNGFSDIYAEQLQAQFCEDDVLIALSVHGGSGQDKAGLWSQNLLKAIQFVSNKLLPSGQSIGLAGFDGGVMKEMCDVCIVVPANSTPLVEGFHSVICHLITECLRERIGG